MWIEKTITEILSFLKGYLLTFLTSLFRPTQIFLSLKGKNKNSFINPITYSFISLILFITFFSSRLNGISYLNNFWFINQSNQITKATVNSLPLNFNITTFLYALPIFLASYLIIYLLIYLFGIKQYQRNIFIKCIYLWAGTAFIFYTLLILFSAIIFEHAHLFIGKSATKSKSLNFYFAVQNLIFIIPYLIPSIPCFYAIVKDFKITRNWKFILIPLIITFSVDYVYFSNRFLDAYLNSSTRNPIVFKGSFETNFIKQYQEIIDTTLNLEATSFDVILSNESDTTFILPKKSTLKLYCYTKNEIKKRDAETAQNLNEIVDSIIRDERKAYDFTITKIENVKDSIIILKPGDIRRVTFSATLSKQDYKDLFQTYASTLKIVKLDFYKSTINTNIWDQFWLKRTLYQMLTFDIYVSKDSLSN